MIDGGVPLQSCAHPRSRWWWLTWMWHWIRPRRISEGAIERIWVTIKIKNEE